MRALTPSTAGEDRRDAVLELLRQRRAALVRRGQRVLLGQLLAAGTATADDVRAVVELPLDIDPRCMGAVPGELADAGILPGFVRLSCGIEDAEDLVEDLKQALR